MGYRPLVITTGGSLTSTDGHIYWPSPTDITEFANWEDSQNFGWKVFCHYKGIVAISPKHLTMPVSSRIRDDQQQFLIPLPVHSDIEQSVFSETILVYSIMALPLPAGSSGTYTITGMMRGRKLLVWIWIRWSWVIFILIIVEGLVHVAGVR